MAGNTTIYDCGCVISRPKEYSCKKYGTQWRLYISVDKAGIPLSIVARCRDCGRARHFKLSGLNPVMIQYMDKEEDEDV